MASDRRPLRDAKINDRLVAFTGVRNFNISRDLLPVAADLRRYFIAHELGRCEGSHSSITFWSANFFLLGTVGVYIVRNSSYSWARSVGITGMLCFLALTGGASLLSKCTTVWLEWNADRRAARMVGVQAMLDGIDLVIPSRKPASNAYYIDKK